MVKNDQKWNNYLRQLWKCCSFVCKERETLISEKAFLLPIFRVHQSQILVLRHCFCLATAPRSTSLSAFLGVHPLYSPVGQVRRSKHGKQLGLSCLSPWANDCSDIVRFVMGFLWSCLIDHACTSQGDGRPCHTAPFISTERQLGTGSRQWVWHGFPAEVLSNQYPHKEHDILLSK